MEPLDIARLPADIDVSHLLDSARKRVYLDPTVIGVGVGLRRRSGKIVNEAVLTVYVKEKRSRDAISNDYLVPTRFENVPTDVMAPFEREYVKEPIEFGTLAHWQVSRDMSFVDAARIHGHALEQQTQGR
jgi:hypothetical protein